MALMNYQKEQVRVALIRAKVDGGGLPLAILTMKAGPDTMSDEVAAYLQKLKRDGKITYDRRMNAWEWNDSVVSDLEEILNAPQDSTPH